MWLSNLVGGRQFLLPDYRLLIIDWIKKTSGAYPGRLFGSGYMQCPGGENLSVLSG